MKKQTNTKNKNTTKKEVKINSKSKKEIKKQNINKISKKEIKQINEEILSKLKTKNRYCEHCGNKIKTTDKKCSNCKSKVNIKNNKTKTFALEYINSAGQGRVLDVVYNTVAKHAYAMILSFSFVGSLLGPTIYDFFTNNRIENPSRFIMKEAKEVKKEETKKEEEKKEEKIEEEKQDEIKEEVQQAPVAQEQRLKLTAIPYNENVVTIAGSDVQFKLNDTNVTIYGYPGLNYTLSSNGTLTIHTTSDMDGDYTVYATNGYSTISFTFKLKSHSTTPSYGEVLEFD